ncbi:MAG: hypothetical protein ACP5N2_06065 [Candidatus Nanoarchaeia archaeon]
MKRYQFRKGVNTLMSRGMTRSAAVGKMRYYATQNKGIRLSAQAAFYLVLIIVFAALGANDSSSVATKLFAGALMGMITSAAAGSIVTSLNGEKLKKISLVIDLEIFKFSITAFTIVAGIVELILFT